MNVIFFHFVHPMRIELISSEPESGILSIELWVHSIIFCHKCSSIATHCKKFCKNSKYFVVLQHDNNQITTIHISIIALVR